MADEVRQLDLAGPDAVVRAVLTVQGDYAEKIGEAAARGDAPAVQELLREMMARTRELTGRGRTPRLYVVASSSTAADAPPRREAYDRWVSSIDLDAIVLDGDRARYLQLVDDERLVGDHASRLPRSLLPAAALLLTPKLAPRVHEVLEQCRARLGLSAAVELYVRSSTELAATCVAAANNRYALVATSSLLEAMEPQELAFVLGREIGHVLLQHPQVEASLESLRAGRARTPLEALQEHAWRRDATLSSDRLGLLAGRNIEAAAAALLKLTTGVGGDALSFQPRDFLTQFADTHKALVDHVGIDPEDWFVSRPFSPTRLRALDLFARSELYCRSAGQDKGNAELSDEQLEFGIHAMLLQIESTFLQERTMLGEQMRGFVVANAYLAIAADGKVAADEMTALGSLLDPNAAEAQLVSMASVGVQAIKAQAASVALALGDGLSQTARLNAVKDLVIVVRELTRDADDSGGKSGPRLDALLPLLHAAASSVGVRGEFVDYFLAYLADQD